MLAPHRSEQPWKAEWALLIRVQMRWGTLPLHSGTPRSSRTQCWSNSFPGFLLYFTLIQWEKVSATARQCPGFCEAGPFIQWALMYRFQWNKSEILYCRRFVPHWKQILIRWLFRDCIGRNGVKMLTPFFPRLALNRHLGHSKKKKRKKEKKTPNTLSTPQNHTTLQRLCIFGDTTSPQKYPHSGMNIEPMG